MIKESFLNKDIKKLGEAITLSSLENQKILYKENLEEIIKTALSYNAYGVNIAHSGTLIGILNDKNTKTEALKKAIKDEYPQLSLLGNYEMVNGGFEYKIRR